MPVELHSPQWRQAFRRRLLSWYRKHARDLPWRESSDPYQVWVSEIMLQQTQVETVRRYFKRFTTRLPTVTHLADAPLEDVLKLWEGLGYYRRARQLHAAAQMVVEIHDGKLPADLDALQALPGIGRYTAGAIASIAFDLPAPILEANTIRLFSRLVALREDPTRAASQRALWKFAADVLPRNNIGQFNQALMELGSLVCKPGMPPCEACPVATLCPTHASEAQLEIPKPTQKTNYVDLHEVAVVLKKEAKLLIRRCEEGERWDWIVGFSQILNRCGTPNDRQTRNRK